MIKIGSIPLHISPTFWLLASVIGWMAAGSIVEFLAWIVIVFVSVVIHELGHALTAKMWGQNVQVILGPLGGTTVYGASSKPLSRLKEFIVVLAGPLFGFFLAGVSILLLPKVHNNHLAYFFIFLANANIIWSLFNLLPVHPFDGGKLMSILFEGVFGPKGMRTSYLLSGIFAVLLTGACMYYGQIFAAALLIMCAFESFKNYKERRYFQTTATELKANELEIIDLNWQQNKQPQAIQQLKELLQKNPDGSLHAQAAYKLAEYLAATNDVPQAYQVLKDEKNKDIETLKLFQLLCYKRHYWQECIDTGNAIFRESQDPSCAIMNAFSSAHLQDINASINWLNIVKKTKAVDMQALLGASDFDSIRQDMRFQKLNTLE